MSDLPLATMVEQAFNTIASQSQPKTAPDATAEAYAAVPSSRALQRFDQLEAARGNTADAFGGIQPRNVIFLMNSQNLAPKGMFSALQPSALQPGQFSLLQNVRIDDKTIRARNSTTLYSSSGLPGTASSIRGIWSGRMNGTVYIVVAAYDGTKVGLYAATASAFPTFTAVTQSSGSFGDSRLTDTGLPVAFQVVNNPGDGLDYLVIQNGTDLPRVYGTNYLAGAYVRVINQFAAPLWASSAKVQGAMYGGGQNGAFSTNLSAVSDTGTTPIVPTLSGSSGTQSVALAFPATPSNGATVLLDFGASGLNLALGGNQLIFVSDQASQNAWSYWKVECSPDNSTWTTIADPTSSTYNAPVRVTFTDPNLGGTSATGGLGGEEVVAFDLTVLTVSAITNQRYLRLTWEGSLTFGSSFTSTIHGIYMSGAQLAFNQQYMVSFAGLAGLSESPGVVMNGFQAKTDTLIGSLKSQSIFVPYVAGVYYDHQVPLQNQSAADLANGCDSIYVYRKDYGATDFFYFGTVTMGSYSSPYWVWTGGSHTTPPNPPGVYTISASTYNTTALNVARYAPDAYTMTMPKGSCLAFANGRSFVGGQNFYAVSEYGQGFRYRPALMFVNGQPVERSATYVQLSGQTVKAFATPSGSALNSQTVFFWTENKTYACGGFDGYSLSRPAVCFEIGCSAPGSVAQYKDAIFWLDDNYQLRRFTYGRSFLYGYSNANAYDLAPAISRMVVDDQTTAIPTAYLPWVKSVAAFDRYYLFYPTSAGTTNTLALVFEENLQAFVQDTLASGAQSACYADLSGGRALLLACADGNVYRHEDPGSSTAHTVNVTSAELSSAMWHPQFFGRVGLVADVQSGQSASVTVTVKPGLSDASTLDLATGATNQVWRWASRTESTPPGVDGESTTQPGLHGVSAQVAVSLTMTPGTRIYALALESTTALPGPDQL